MGDGDLRRLDRRQRAPREPGEVVPGGHGAECTEKTSGPALPGLDDLGYAEGVRVKGNVLPAMGGRNCMPRKDAELQEVLHNLNIILKYGTREEIRAIEQLLERLCRQIDARRASGHP